MLNWNTIQSFFFSNTSSTRNERIAFKRKVLEQWVTLDQSQYWIALEYKKNFLDFFRWIFQSMLWFLKFIQGTPFFWEGKFSPTLRIETKITSFVTRVVWTKAFINHWVTEPLRASTAWKRLRISSGLCYASYLRLIQLLNSKHGNWIRTLLNQ